ncbi:orotidine-5'-phosphate decarboxylase [uncultured Bifidobacterium sp.]|uniref:orotidine-5'-phosphate decarboxylase n=1 Tax=uncultured Bifidobacterium sp. TaxID=165187 RepID=UPI0028DC71D3|nr:orotidine-5'-phosphate decarboxylase [uncultured Bifidobacterium sp.]
MDRLIEAIERTGNPSVVGLDPTDAVVPTAIAAGLEREVRDSVEAEELPASLRAVAYLEFCRAIIDAVADVVPAVKPQIAMFEALGPAGLDSYALTCAHARERGLYVIGDVKRGDIGSTATAYARHLTGVPVADPAGTPGGHAAAPEGSGMGRAPSHEGSTDAVEPTHAVDVWGEDAITVNPYLGSDGVTPFVRAAETTDKDLFVLVRTSNPSSAEIQECELADGRPLYERVADLVGEWGSGSIGRHGYSRVGAVVGATQADQGALLRRRMPHAFFLVPGYGAQGGTARDIARMADPRGSGILVNSSRGIIGAWRGSGEERPGMPLDAALDMVARHARRAAIAMREDIRTALKDRGRPSAPGRR